MYGTIARLHPKPDAMSEFLAYGERIGRMDIPGMRASYMFRPDQNQYERETVFLLALFDDAASYRANAGSPEQHERYLEMRSMLEDDPDWMDGTFDAV